MSRVRATGRVPRGFAAVTGAITPIATARPSQKIQLIGVGNEKRKSSNGANGANLSRRFHPCNALLELLPHRFWIGRMVTPAVPGQDPLETEVEQPLHRTDLLGPGVPARVPERDEPVSPLRPGQVVAGEEELLPVEEHGVAPRVAGRRDREEVFGERDR